jgi:hypothetical protein
LARVKYPNPVFFSQRRRPSDWAKGNLFTSRFHLQGVTGLKMQPLSQLLWDYNSPSFVYSEMVRHNGIQKWVEPLINAILTNP